MIDFLYNIIIFPLVQIIEISFVIVYRIFNDKALAILGVSAAVTALTTPLYFIAEKWQKNERELRARLEQKIRKIKSVFKGDEQYMVLSAYYRQNHYHPIYSLRSSLGLFIQIPFFLAAYSYLSGLELIKGVPFFFIRDLGAPDRLFSLGGFYLNLLPVLMTAINCVSGAVYTKGLAIREKVQVYGMAFIFLILLYNSPSGLVLYWTMNNIYSLLKNILSKTKHSQKIVYVFICLCVIFVDIRFIPLGFSPKRLFVAALCSLVFFLPLFVKLFKFCANKFSSVIQLEHSSLSGNKTFILSACILFILSGLVIPASLIASSVQEFSYLDSYTIPLPFIYTVFTQALGIFIFWPLIVYFLFPKNVKILFTFVISLISVTALINTFLFPGDYGFLTTTFRFSNPDTFESKYKIIILSAFATVGLLCGFIYLLLITKKKNIFYSFQLIILSALVFFGIYNVYKIQSDFKDFENQRQQSVMGGADSEKPEPVYHFSRNGKNVVVIMLDAAISGYVPYIFNEKPELLKNFSGFTYYPNCVSFGGHTRIGAPVLFGGYEYEPRLIQKDRSYAKEKHNEALLMMPRIFLNAGYRVTVTEPAFANYSWKPDLSIFSPYPKITAQNIRGNYTGMWLRSHPEMKIVSVPELLRELLIRFSFLKISPPAFRIFIYDRGDWLKENNASEQLSLDTLDCYTTLYYLPLITDISDGTENSYTAMVNDLTHDTAIFQYPDYVPKMVVTNKGDGPFSEKESYHAMMVAFLLLGKWFGLLQEQGVYDNARIVIVSDHGKSEDSKYSGNMLLPNNDWLSGYHALLMVKDFVSNGELVTNTAFMTHGDVPAIAMNGLIDSPKNPFSGNPVTSAIKNDAVITTASVLQYKIADDQWLSVHENIFAPDNWEKVKN